MMKVTWLLGNDDDHNYWSMTKFSLCRGRCLIGKAVFFIKSSNETSAHYTDSTALRSIGSVLSYPYGQLFFRKITPYTGT